MIEQGGPPPRPQILQAYAHARVSGQHEVTVTLIGGAPGEQPIALGYAIYNALNPGVLYELAIQAIQAIVLLPGFGPGIAIAPAELAAKLRDGR